MAERGKHRVAPAPAPTKKQYAYVPCPRSEEVGTEFVQLRPPPDLKSLPPLPPLLPLPATPKKPASRVFLQHC
ncbi:hypothetical protein MSG28_009842 [Choristoneura fumiferana]|uniref:Uncharacterized protein n=1 Tax=Choristoneura fumiferana TaxID=7141 RepID=A0ACC0JCV5_CHOFU|nr:hypothetical protein MSG28_009842 [Choristoneura fumiferana]